jgi:integrase/recombinase XerD
MPRHLARLPSSHALPSMELLAAIPEEDLWLQGQLSHHTRRAYKEDVLHFMRSVGVASRDDLRKVSRASVIAWMRIMESQDAKPRTVRRRLAALSSLFNHLIEQHVITASPVQTIKRPKVNRRTGVTKAFSPQQARTLLDAPDDNTLGGLRDRAILSVLLQAGPRRAEVASMRVKNFHQDGGYWSIQYTKKGDQEHSLSLNPQTVTRIRQYLDAGGHGDDLDGPLFRTTKTSKLKPENKDRFLSDDLIDRIVRKYMKQVPNCERGFSAHSCRATFATNALEKGCPLEDVQEALGHADSRTTKLYDKRGHNPEKSAAFFANY